MDIEQRVESLEKTVNTLLDILHDHFLTQESDSENADATRLDLLKLYNDFNK